MTGYTVGALLNELLYGDTSTTNVNDILYFKIQPAPTAKNATIVPPAGNRIPRIACGSELWQVTYDICHQELGNKFCIYIALILVTKGVYLTNIRRLQWI